MAGHPGAHPGCPSSLQSCSKAPVHLPAKLPLSRVASLRWKWSSVQHNCLVFNRQAWKGMLCARASDVQCFIMPHGSCAHIPHPSPVRSFTSTAFSENSVHTHTHTHTHILTWRSCCCKYCPENASLCLPTAAQACCSSRCARPTWISIRELTSFHSVGLSQHGVSSACGFNELSRCGGEWAAASAGGAGQGHRGPSRLRLTSSCPPSILKFLPGHLCFAQCPGARG